MDKKFGYYVLVGLVIGAAFGLGFGATNGYPLMGVGGGALAGVFIGWFIAAILIEKKEDK
jgi:ABC-type uncharacterized transport system permease subunit